MIILAQVSDSATLVGTTPLKAGTVLERSGNNYKALTVANNADAILLKDTTPTALGVVCPIAVGGVVEFIDEAELYLPTGITAKLIQLPLRKLGLYLKGVN